jgi:hypothetical protein
MPREYLTMPVLESYPFGFSDCEADAAAFRRARVRRLSSSDGSLLARFRLYVKKLQQNVFRNEQRLRRTQRAIAGFGWISGPRADRRAFLTERELWVPAIPRGRRFGLRRSEA